MNEFNNEYNNEPNIAKPIVKNAIPEKSSSTLSVCSIVLGSLGLICFWAFIWNLIISIAGVITGSLCIVKKHKNQTIAIVGTVISSIALVLSFISCILYVLALSL